MSVSYFMLGSVSRILLIFSVLFNYALYFKTVRQYFLRIGQRDFQGICDVFSCYRKS